MSARMPPTMVEKVDPPRPPKKRATSMPVYELVREHANCMATKRIPVAMKTGRRPLISENGARNMGPIPKPAVNTVIPTLYATRETPHSSVSCASGAAYAPAE